MKLFTKCIAGLLGGVMLTSGTAFAYKERIDKRAKGGAVRSIATANDIFCYDFAKGETDGLVLNPVGGGKLGIYETSGADGAKQSALLMEDLITGQDYGGPIVRKSFDAVTSGKIGFEMRFKFESVGEKDFAGFQIAVKAGSNMVLRIYVDGNSGKLGWVPSGTMGQMTPGEWYKIRFIYDIDNGQAEIIYTSDELSNGYIRFTNLAAYDGGTGQKIDSVELASRYYSGEWYIDYLRMDKGADLESGFVKPPFKHPDTLIEAPVTAAPTQRAVPGKINVNVNGEYMYYATAPAFDGEDLMVTTSAAFRSFGMSTVVGSGGMKAMYGDKEVVLTADSAEMTVGGEKKTLSKAVGERNGQRLVSINSMAEALGYTTQWSAEDNTLYITGGAQ